MQTERKDFQLRTIVCLCANLNVYDKSMEKNQEQKKVCWYILLFGGKFVVYICQESLPN